MKTVRRVMMAGCVGERLGEAWWEVATSYQQRPAWSHYGLTQLRNWPGKDWSNQRSDGV